MTALDTLTEIRKSAPSNAEFVQTMADWLATRNVLTKNFGWVRAADYKRYAFLKRDVGIPVQRWVSASDKSGKIDYPVIDPDFYSWKDRKRTEVYDTITEMSMDALIDSYPQELTQKRMPYMD